MWKSSVSDPRWSNEANKAVVYLETNSSSMTLHRAPTDCASRGRGYERRGGSREKTSQHICLVWGINKASFMWTSWEKDPKNTHRASLVNVLAFFILHSREESAAVADGQSEKGKKRRAGRCFYCEAYWHYTVQRFAIWDWQHKICMLIHMLSLFPWIFNTPASLRVITPGFTLSNKSGEVLSAVPVSLIPWLSQALQSINHSFWQVESKGIDFKSELGLKSNQKETFVGYLTQKHERTKPIYGGKYWSRATERCGKFRCRWVWICASRVWWDRCRGYVEVKVAGSNFTAAVEQCCLKVAGRLQLLLVHECIFSKQSRFYV